MKCLLGVCGWDGEHRRRRRGFGHLHGQVGLDGARQALRPLFSSGGRSLRGRNPKRLRRGHDQGGRHGVVDGPEDGILHRKSDSGFAAGYEDFIRLEWEASTHTGGGLGLGGWHRTPKSNFSKKLVNINALKPKIVNLLEVLLKKALTPTPLWRSSNELLHNKLFTEICFRKTFVLCRNANRKRDNNTLKLFWNLL